MKPTNCEHTKTRSERRALTLCVLLLGVLALGSKAIPEGEDFGDGVQLSNITPMKEIMKNPESFADETILVSGRISDVCQKKGCWTVLSDGDFAMRIRFKDYGFFVPKDSRGQKAFVEGVVVVETLSQRDARHYAAESIGADPSKVHGPQREIGFTANGVRILARTPLEK